MFLLIGFGVFYHYVIYLPGVERQKEEKAKEEKRALEEKETRTRLQYERCIAGARQNYEANWAQACETHAKNQAQSLNICLENRTIMSNPDMGANYCNRMYRHFDSSPKCALPDEPSDKINQRYKEEQDKCLTEARAGF